jgi:hypothetical protein
MQDRENAVHLPKVAIDQQWQQIRIREENLALVIGI